MEEIKMKYEQEIKSISDEYESFKRNTNRSLEQANEKLNEYELKL